MEYVKLQKYKIWPPDSGRPVGDWIRSAGRNLEP